MNWFANFLKSLNRGIAELSPGCRQAARLQSDALDSKLRLAQRLGLRLHLFLCKWCRRYGRQIAFLRTAVHQHADDERVFPKRGLSTEARERIKRALESADGE